jgi:hypothetical protein
MTSAQMNLATKASLINYIAELESAKLAAEQNTKDAINIANYFAQVITQIEKLLLESPFVNKDGKFFKNLFWVISNFSAIKTAIETIIAQIKDWRKQIENLNKKSEAPTT